MSGHTLLASLLLAALAVTTASLAVEQVERSPEQIEEDNLWAMSRTSNGDHVDLFFEYAGLENYADKHYQAALHDFKMAAFYADKPSQLSIGLMYLQGEGVPRDPAMAWAWVHLAAERGYPSFLTTEQMISRQLSPQQQRQAEAYFYQLAARYADKVTKPHLIRDMHLSMMMVNPTGHVPLGLISQTGGHAIQARPCAMDPNDGSAEENCSGYPTWRHDADSYFSARDAQWQPLQGHVTVRDLQPVAAASTPAHPQAPTRTDESP